MNPVKITVFGVKKKANPSNLNAPNLKLITDNSESLKTEENIQGFFNSNSNWNIVGPTTTYISKSQLDNNPSDIDIQKFVDVSKYIDIAQICKQDLNDQRIDLLEYNYSIRQQPQQNDISSSQICSKNDDNDIESSNIPGSTIFTSKQPKEEMTPEEKEEIKTRLIRKKKKLQIKNQQLVSYFADKKKSIYSFDPQLVEEERLKKEKLYRKPDFLGELKRDLVNDEKTVKFIEKNWFLFSQSAETPSDYMKGMKKIKDVYDELRVRIQKQQEATLMQEEQELIEHILEQQRQDSPRRSLSTKKQQKKRDSKIVCMLNAASAANSPKKPQKKYNKSGTLYNIKVRQTHNQNFFSNQQVQSTRSADTSFHTKSNTLNSPISNGLRTYNEDVISPSNYYTFEGETTSTANPSLYENLQSSTVKFEKILQNQSQIRHAKFDEKARLPQNHTYSSVSTRILDSRVRTTNGSITSFQGSPSRIAINSRKNTENDLNRNKANILQINKMQIRGRSQTNNNNNNSNNNNSNNNNNKISLENNDQIFNFCHSAIGESETVNILNSDFENEQEQDDLRAKQVLYNQQNSQLSHRSQLSSSTTLQESSRGTSFSLDNPSSYMTNINFLTRKRKYLNMNEIKISTYTAKEQYLQEHNPLKYELYVVPQTTKDLISRANRQGKYLYQKQFTPRNYGQVSNIKRELIIS